MTTSCGHLPPRHCGRGSQGSLEQDCSVFLSPPKVAQSQTISHLWRWCLTIVVWNTGNEKMFFFFNGSLSHRRSHWYSKSGLILQLGLQIYHLGHLSYLVVQASTSPSLWGCQGGAADCFPIYSVDFLSLHDFWLSCSFLVPDALSLFLLFRI
jgi:hypothetical protein